MKVLLVDISSDGHHQHYLNLLATKFKESNEVDISVALPSEAHLEGCKQYIVQAPSLGKLDIGLYNKWITEIGKIVDDGQFDIVHFLTGDIFYRYFGIGVKSKIKSKTVVTLHHVRLRSLRKYSLKRLADKAGTIVVHTEYLQQQLQDELIHNIECVAYPKIEEIKTSLSTEESKRHFGQDKNLPLLLALGEMRYDKGLDILLDALKFINSEYALLIAGKELDFDTKFIETKAGKDYAHVTVRSGYLSDEDFQNAVKAADVMVMPYRSIFNGASGPMTEGVWERKPVIVPDHGSLGETVKRNKLGVTFESENPQALASAIDMLLAKPFAWSEEAEKYRSKLTPDCFVEAYLGIYKDVLDKK